MPNTVTKPMALDESFKTTETTPRNIADVLAEMGEAIAQGMGRQANEVAYNNTTSGLSADDVQEAIDELAEEKVDKVSGKCLSTNDYTTDEKTKLAGIAAGAEVNVQSDWAQSDDEEDDYIKNKPQVDVESLPDTTPYLYRKSPAIGTRVMENALVGASVVKNQLVQNGNFAENSGWTTASSPTLVIANNKATISKANVTNTSISLMLADDKNFNAIAGHKYLFRAKITSNNQVAIVPTGTTSHGVSPYVSHASGDVVYYIWNPQSDYNNVKFQIRVYTGSGVTADLEAVIENCNCFDITQYFGSSTIADTAYTKETAQAGSGIAWLKDNGFDFSKYIPYNTGTLESVEVTGKEVVGFNQFNERTRNGYYNTDCQFVAYSGYTANADPISVFPNITYHFESKSAAFGRICWYDIDGNKISYTVPSVASINLTSPENARFLNFDMSSAYGGTYKGDVCINISKTEGTPKNGDYVPYEKHTYAYPETTLRGLFELVNDNIVANGDRLESDGTHEVVYDEVDLGTLSWDKQTYNDEACFRAVLSTAPSPVVGGITNAICERYTLVNGNLNAFLAVDKSIYVSSTSINLTTSYVAIHDSNYSEYTAEQLATAISGVYLEYPLATPTTESLAPFDNPQISIVNGTEQFITNTDVPVGHESEYKKLPDMFEDDYIQYLQTQAENATQNVSVAPPTLHAYDSTTHKMGTNGDTPSSWDVEDMPSQMKDFYQKFETAINDHGNQIANIPADWTFIQNVTSTSGESVTIPNTANYIMVLLFGAYSPDPLLLPTYAVCNSLEAHYGVISISHYDVELHGTYHNVDHYVKYDDESHKWSVSDANTSASIFYR